MQLGLRRRADLDVRFDAKAAHDVAFVGDCDRKRAGLIVEHQFHERHARLPLSRERVGLLVVGEFDFGFSCLPGDVHRHGPAANKRHPVLALRTGGLDAAGDARHARAQKYVGVGSGGNKDFLHLRRRCRAVETVGEFFLDIARCDLAGLKAFLVQHRRQERRVVLDALHFQTLKRLHVGCDCGVAILAVGDQLRDHRIVEHRDFVALADAGVDTDSSLGKLALGRETHPLETTDGRQEATIRVLGIDAGLKRPAIDPHILLLDRKLLAGGDAQHLLDQVVAGDHLGHRVLNLQARVHLEEVEITLSVDDEFDRAGAVVLHGACERDGLFAHRLTGLGREEGRWRLFEDLLVAALDRAFALVQVDDIAMLVAEHLDLDVARLVDEFLNENAIVTEGGDRFGTGSLETFLGFAGIEGDAQALAAAARGRLDHHGIADGVGDLHSLFPIGDQTHVARHGVDASLSGKLLRRDLVAHGLDRVRIGSDEDDFFILQALRERRVLRKEAETGMHGLRTRLLHGGDDLVLHQIALGRRRAADMDGFIRHLDGHGARVRVGIDHDGLHTHSPGRLDHPAGDFPAICDQDFREHPLPRQAADCDGKVTKRPVRSRQSAKLSLSRFIRGEPHEGLDFQTPLTLTDRNSLGFGDPGDSHGAVLLRQTRVDRGIRPHLHIQVCAVQTRDP